MRTGLVALYAWLDWRQRGTISVGTAVVVHQYSQQIGTVVAAMAMHWNDLVRQKTEVADVDPILTAPARPLDVSAVAEQWKRIRVEGLRFFHPRARGASPEAQLYEGLLEAFADACIVSSVHRLHLLARFDTVLLMEHGRIIDRGTPQEVAHRQPAFFAHGATQLVPTRIAQRELIT